MKPEDASKMKANLQSIINLTGPRYNGDSGTDSHRLAKETLALLSTEPDASQEAQAWRTMESADKGTPQSAEIWAAPDMLLWNGEFIQQGSYNVGEEEWWDSDGPILPQPTHWTRLPMPPNPNAEAKEEDK